MKKVNKEEALKGLIKNHTCEKCGKLLTLAEEIYIEEYENDSTDYFCECVVK